MSDAILQPETRTPIVLGSNAVHGRDVGLPGAVRRPGAPCRGACAVTAERPIGGSIHGRRFANRPD
jgi:hypothetical protein